MVKDSAAARLVFTMKSFLCRHGGCGHNGLGLAANNTTSLAINALLSFRYDLAFFGIPLNRMGTIS